jgi:hypothetical protein
MYVDRQAFACLQSPANAYTYACIRDLNFFFSIENKKYGLAESQLKVGFYGLEKTATFRR